jgi:hypothetical protein
MYTELRIIYFSDTYSLPDLTIEQREFGILSDVVRSGVKRSYKKYVGRARRSIGNKLDKSISEDINKRSKILDELKSRSNPVINPRSEQTISQLSSDKYNTEILTPDPSRYSGKSTYISSSKRFKNIKPDDLKEVSNGKFNGISNEMADILSKNKGLIISPKGSGTDSLAHEVGHVMNKKDSILSRIRSLGDSISRSTKIPYKDLKNKKGLGLGEYVRGKIIVSEEKAASKNGMKILKGIGMSSDELRRSKEYLDKSLDTYKLEASARRKTPIKNLIQIPSRRGKI